MRRGIDTAVTAIVLLASVEAAATELKYVWRKDAVERYRYEETVHWKGGAILSVHAQFAARVRATRADGRVTVEWILEALDASLGTQSFELHDQVPAQERRVVIVADAKGHFTVPQTWSVELRDGRPTVARRAADAGASQMIDVPRRLLALLALPDGPLARGRAVQVKNGRLTMHWRLASVDGTAATLYVSPSAAPPPTTGHAATQSPKREDADLVVRFDAAEGRLLEVRGTLIWTQPTRVISRVLMQRLSQP
jgi:hypothetical protein